MQNLRFNMQSKIGKAQTMYTEVQMDQRGCD